MSKQIALTKGYSATVDDDDFDFLSQWKWCVSVGNGGKPYAVRNLPKTRDSRRVQIRMHREVNRTPEGLHTDHRNGDTLDNRKANLRSATVSQNMANRVTNHKRRTSRFKGVHWHAQRCKWTSRIEVNGERHYLGVFDSEDAAAAAYAARAIVLLGEYWSNGL